MIPSYYHHRVNILCCSRQKHRRKKKNRSQSKNQSTNLEKIVSEVHIEMSQEEKDFLLRSGKQRSGATNKNTSNIGSESSMGIAGSAGSQLSHDLLEKAKQPLPSIRREMQQVRSTIAFLSFKFFETHVNVGSIY